MAESETKLLSSHLQGSDFFLDKGREGHAHHLIDIHAAVERPHCLVGTSKLLLLLLLLLSYPRRPPRMVGGRSTWCGVRRGPCQQGGGVDDKPTGSIIEVEALLMEEMLGDKCQ